MEGVTGAHAAWLLLSFAIMVVAVLARLSDRLEKLEKRLEQLESPAPRGLPDRQEMGREW